MSAHNADKIINAAKIASITLTAADIRLGDTRTIPRMRTLAFEAATLAENTPEYAEIHRRIAKMVVDASEMLDGLEAVTQRLSQSLDALEATGEENRKQLKLKMSGESIGVDAHQAAHNQTTFEPTKEDCERLAGQYAKRGDTLAEQVQYHKDHAARLLEGLQECREEHGKLMRENEDTKRALKERVELIESLTKKLEASERDNTRLNDENNRVRSQDTLGIKAEKEDLVKRLKDINEERDHWREKYESSFQEQQKNIAELEQKLKYQATIKGIDCWFASAELRDTAVERVRELQRENADLITQREHAMGEAEERTTERDNMEEKLKIAKDNIKALETERDEAIVEAHQPRDGFVIAPWNKHIGKNYRVGDCCHYNERIAYQLTQPFTKELTTVPGRLTNWQAIGTVDEHGRFKSYDIGIGRVDRTDTEPDTSVVKDSLITESSITGKANIDGLDELDYTPQEGDIFSEWKDRIYAVGSCISYEGIAYQRNGTEPKTATNYPAMSSLWNVIGTVNNEGRFTPDREGSNG